MAHRILFGRRDSSLVWICVLPCMKLMELAIRRTVPVSRHFVCIEVINWPNAMKHPACYNDLKLPFMRFFDHL
jgi:hypothetical protein